MGGVVVVGGGLAGCAAAIHLARRGLEVTVLERTRAAGRKACGEGLFPGGVAALERLDIGGIRDQSVGLRGIRFQAGSASAEAPFAGGRSALGVRRAILDAALREAAVGTGVCLRTGVAAVGLHTERGRVVAVETNAGPVEAGVVIAADGLGSRMRRLAGLDSRKPGSRYGISAHVTLARSMEPMVQVWFDRGFELYVTPVADHEANVAVLTWREGMARFAGRRGQAFAEVAAIHPALRDGFELNDEPLAAGPFAQGCSRAWRGNLVLVGDAAGFFDGITGEGMTAALLGAERAAVAVSEYIDSGTYEGFRRYERERRALTRNSDALGSLSLALGRWPALAQLAVRNLGAQPETFARLVAVNTGEAGLRTLRPRDAMALAFGR